ncbi:hypothetical protein F4782DRAFT_534527 [Xylaria castorea]|nr:hypothetical protein F4782DRAFT_534527 [Xylaria castorea]
MRLKRLASGWSIRPYLEEYVDGCWKAIQAIREELNEQVASLEQADRHVDMAFLCEMVLKDTPLYDPENFQLMVPFGTRSQGLVLTGYGSRQNNVGATRAGPSHVGFVLDRPAADSKLFPPTTSPEVPLSIVKPESLPSTGSSAAAKESAPPHRYDVVVEVDDNLQSSRLPVRLADIPPGQPPFVPASPVPQQAGLPAATRVPSWMQLDRVLYIDCSCPKIMAPGPCISQSRDWLYSLANPSVIATRAEVAEWHARVLLNWDENRKTLADLRQIRKITIARRLARITRAVMAHSVAPGSIFMMYESGDTRWTVYCTYPDCVLPASTEHPLQDNKAIDHFRQHGIELTLEVDIMDDGEFQGVDERNESEVDEVEQEVENQDIENLNLEDLDDLEEELFDGNICPKENYRKDMRTLNETEYDRKEYAPGTEALMNMVEKKWFIFCRDILE